MLYEDVERVRVVQVCVATKHRDAGHWLYHAIAQRHVRQRISRSACRQARHKRHAQRMVAELGIDVGEGGVEERAVARQVIRCQQLQRVARSNGELAPTDPPQHIKTAATHVPVQA